MGCVRSELLGAAKASKTIADRLPAFVDPEEGATASEPSVQDYPFSDDLRSPMNRLTQWRAEMADLEQRKSMLYPTTT